MMNKSRFYPMSIRTLARRRMSVRAGVGRNQTAPRRGTTLVELMVSGILLGTVMMVTVPTLGWIAKERRAAQRRQEAIAEVANLMERVTVTSWEQITPQGLGQIKLSEDSARQLPGAVLKLDVVSNPSDPNSKQIVIDLRWKNRTGRIGAPVRLSAWVYRNGRGE